MRPTTAKRWIVVSALVVGAAYWYRRLKEGPTAVIDVGEFFTAWGVVYFGLALLSEAAPGVAGSFAIVAMVGDLLIQGKALSADVGLGLSGASATAGSPNGSSPSAGQGLANIGQTVTPNTVNEAVSPRKIARPRRREK